MTFRGKRAYARAELSDLVFFRTKELLIPPMSPLGVARKINYSKDTSERGIAPSFA